MCQVIDCQHKYTGPDVPLHLGGGQHSNIWRIKVMAEHQQQPLVIRTCPHTAFNTLWWLTAP